MHERIDKKQKNQSKSVANAVSQKKNNGKKGFWLVDNRPKAFAQRKLQEVASNHSSQQHAPIQMMIGNELVRLNYEWGIPSVQKAIRALGADSWHNVQYEDTLAKLHELKAAGTLGPTTRDEVEVRGSNARTDTDRFRLMYNVTEQILAALRRGGLTNEDFMLGGSYAAA